MLKNQGWLGKCKRQLGEISTLLRCVGLEKAGVPPAFRRGCLHDRPRFQVFTPFRPSGYPFFGRQYSLSGKFPCGVLGVSFVVWLCFEVVSEPTDCLTSALLVLQLLSANTIKYEVK
ncbi:unnamed protein product [Pylaiella littoralis]